MANTQLEIRNETYSLLWEPTDSTDEYAPSRVNADINTFQDLVMKGEIKSELEEKTFTSPDLRFMRKKSYITLASPTKTTVAVVITDTEISFNTTNFTSSWYVMIEGDVIQYTGKSDTQITGVTGIDTTHALSKQVEQVYLIPATAWKIFWLEYVTTEIPNSQTFVNEIDFRSDKDFNKYYTVVGNNDSISSQFINIHWYSNEDRFIIHYYNLSTDMAADGDTTDLPDNYGKFVLAPLVAGSILYYTDEAALGKEYLKKGYANLETMYSQYADQTKKYRPYIKSPSINRWQANYRIYRRY